MLQYKLFYHYSCIKKIGKASWRRENLDLNLKDKISFCGRGKAWIRGFKGLN